MYVDYTQVFATPDELADFLLLEAEEQDRLLFNLVIAGKISDANARCEIIRNNADGKTICTR